VNVLSDNDMYKVFEQFSAVSKMMSERDFGGGQSSMEQAAELIKLFGAAGTGRGGASSASGGAAEPKPRHGGSLNIDNILLILRLMEARKRLEAYCESIMRAAALEDEDWRKGMLRSIRPNMDEDKKHVIDAILKYMELSEALAQIPGGGRNNSGKRVTYGIKCERSRKNTERQRV